MADSYGTPETPGDDVLVYLTLPNNDEVHVYANHGDDTVTLSIEPEWSNGENKGFDASSGHHVFLENRFGPTGVDYGYDIVNFVNTSNVPSGKTIVGRFQDFDNSRDKLYYEGTLINLYNLPSNMRILSHEGGHNDPGAADQQWLHITTATGGNLLYALEGARADMTGDGGNGLQNGGDMEWHFLKEKYWDKDLNGGAGGYVYTDHVNNLFANATVVDYFDPVDYIPEGYSADGGNIYVDNDIPDDNTTAASKVLQVIQGSANGDLISAGLNNDNVDAGGGNDRVWGGSGNDSISGGFGNDTIYASIGDDKLWGGNGDDILLGSRGADLLNGGAGTDRAAYYQATEGVVADLQNSAANTGEAAGDTYADIEDLQGSNFDDYLLGNAQDNVIWAGNGDDTINGRDGNDIVLGGAGADVLIGGAGTDRAAYWNAAAVLADLQYSGSNTGEAAGDTYSGIEDLQGTGFDDDLRGDALINVIWGGDGNDVIHARNGNDTLHGGNGNDVLLGGLGADVLNGGDGTDRAAYWNSASAVVVDMQNTALNTGEAAGDTYSFIEPTFSK